MSAVALPDLSSAHPLAQADAPRPRNGDRRSRSRWTIAVCVAVGVHLMILGMLHVPLESVKPAPVEPPKVIWVGDTALQSESVLSEQLDIFDSAPLFLPTALNYASYGDRIRGTKPPGELFDLYAAKLVVPEKGEPPRLVAPPVAVESAIGAAKIFGWPYLSAFGREDRGIARLPDRLAAIEVRDHSTGALVLHATLPRSLLPNGAAPWGEWQPFEVLVGIDSTGVLGPPLILEKGSTSETVDSFFRDFLGRTFRLDLRVAAGYYRVIVGP